MGGFIPPFDPSSEEVKPVGEPVSMARHHSARTKDRKQALDILFDSDLRGRSIQDCLDVFVFEAGVPLRIYSRQIVSGVDDHAQELDEVISSCLSGWTLDRIPRVDRCLARIATWELAHTDTPTAVVIAEALNLADELSTDNSQGFLNGLLNSVATQLRQK